MRRFSETVNIIYSICHLAEVKGRHNFSLCEVHGGSAIARVKEDQFGTMANSRASSI